jgi:DNA-binding NtrC family response regulator
VNLIPSLARSLLAEYAARNGRRIVGIAPAAMQALAAHSWPGNIRELRNVMERAVALCPGEVVELDDLPDVFHGIAPTIAPARESLSAAAGSLHTPGGAPRAPIARPGVADGPPSQAPATLPFAAPVAGLWAADGSPSGRSALSKSKDRAELSLITQALERHGHNRLRAAAELGISRMTLYKKLHKYGLMGAC